jgi:type I restriction enzyme S subunit
MWFSRSEFDREACFYAIGGVRGSLEWDDFCDMQLPVPPVEKQQEIVAEYKTVTNRIEINNRLIQKLEETAQAIYKQWFVDFEFPDEEGKPYKSNGGEMVESEMEEVPKGWRVKRIGEISEIKAGGDKPQIYSEIKTEICSVPIYSNGTINEGLFGYTDSANYPKNSITVSARGTIGYCELRDQPFEAIVRLIVVMPQQSYQAIYLCDTIKRITFDNSGSVQNQLTIPQFSSMQFVLPDSDILMKYDSIISPLLGNKGILKIENQKLGKLKELLLAKMVKEIIKH